MSDLELFDPEAETRSPEDQKAKDEPVYRRQIEYLFANSPFYRDKLNEAGFKTPESVGGLDDLRHLPFTVKDELRASQAEHLPLGKHLAAPLEDIVRVYSTSGTSGNPLYIPVTANDLKRWIHTSNRSYFAAGIRPHHRIITTYNSGPFAAGAVHESMMALGVRMVPVGSGNTERLLTILSRFKIQGIPGTPSYFLYLAEAARERGIDPTDCGLETLVAGGEPGGGEPTVRAQIEAAFDAKVHEVLGLGEVSISMFGEGPEQDGMNFLARDYIHMELIDPETEEPIPFEDGARGEPVYTHLMQEGAPLLRYRSRDHVIVSMGEIASGRTGPRIRCVGRTDDMLIVRGVNVFPSAIREVVNEYRPDVSGMISVRPSRKGVQQLPPLRVLVELEEDVTPADRLAETIEGEIRKRLIVTTRVELVPFGTLPRSDYKNRLLDYADATD
ncbi:MAG: AMP-binding protein [Alphaproteobacteria bacterium]|nr:AMP-binding protein [Alphaproteobacteria bacterium]